MQHLQIVLYWGLPCLGILLLLWVVAGSGRRKKALPPIAISQKSHRAGDVGEARVNAVLSRIKGLEYLPAFSFEFRNNGKIDSCQMDHLVRGDDRLWIVETKNWSGTVASSTFVSDRWSVTARSGHFREDLNPLIQANRQSKWLSQQLGVPISFLIAMAGTAIPDQGGWPNGVVLLSNLARVLEGNVHNPHGGERTSPRQVEKGWQAAKRLAYTDRDGSVTRRHIERMSIRHSDRNIDSRKKGSYRSIMLLVAILCGVAWWYLPKIIP